jgi:hypothetical protein
MSSRALAVGSGARAAALRSPRAAAPAVSAARGGRGVAAEVMTRGAAAAAAAGGGDGPPDQLLYCSFNVAGSCRHALATRVCADCARFDITSTGLHCEGCFAARHPW